MLSLIHILQKASHLPAGMHEILTPPLAVPHLPVWLFVQRGAVIVREGLVIHREMPRAELKNQADSVLMKQIHHFFQPVSYTHLDVYKRQYWLCCFKSVT